MASRGDDAVIMGGFFLAGLFFRATSRLFTWLIQCAVWLFRHPVMLGVLVAGWLTVGVANALPHGWWIIGGFALSLSAAVYVLGVKWPARYEQWIAYPLRCLWHGYLYRRDWQPAMVTSGLDRRYEGETVLPRLTRVDARPDVDTLSVVMPAGQVIEDWISASEQLRTTLCLNDVRVEATNVPNRLIVRLLRVDPLSDFVPPLVAGAPSLDALPVGRFENGDVYFLGLPGIHLLIGGASNAGKSSVVWSVVAGLVPLVQASLVEIWVIDPKGGIELDAGRPLFHRFIHGSTTATVEQETAEALEELITLMQQRQDEMRGHARKHVAAPGSPHIVLLVDELAALTAYSTDRDALKRINAALKLLLSQGRAAGITVIAAVQDPRKETVPMRDLFTKRIGLRLTEAEQVDMLLGDGARRSGAQCDRIPEHLPGIGYVKTDGVREPQRVRFSYYSDDDIHALVEQYTPPAERSLALNAAPEDDDQATDAEEAA